MIRSIHMLVVSSLRAAFANSRTTSCRSDAWLYLLNRRSTLQDLPGLYILDY